MSLVMVAQFSIGPKPVTHKHSIESRADNIVRLSFDLTASPTEAPLAPNSYLTPYTDFSPSPHSHSSAMRPKCSILYSI